MAVIRGIAAPTTSPTTPSGVEGDTYFRYASVVGTGSPTVYSYKSGVWVYVSGSAASEPIATGPKGATGSTGPQGNTGPQGVVGARGAKGDTGPQGLIGPQGPQGLKGDKGDKGEVGPQGPTGADGLIGPQGPRGLRGLQGVDGVPGPQGLQGNIGPKGATGPQGPKGDAGAGASFSDIAPIVDAKLALPLAASVHANSKSMNGISALRGVIDTSVAQSEEGTIYRRWGTLSVADIYDGSKPAKKIANATFNTNGSEHSLFVEYAQCYVDDFGMPSIGVNPSNRNTRIIHISELPTDRLVYIDRVIKADGTVIEMAESDFTGTIHKPLLSLDAAGVLVEFLSVSSIGNFSGDKIEFECPVEANIQRIMPNFNSEGLPDWDNSVTNVERTMLFQRPTVFNMPMQSQQFFDVTCTEADWNDASNDDKVPNLSNVKRAISNWVLAKTSPIWIEFDNVHHTTQSLQSQINLINQWISNHTP